MTEPETQPTGRVMGATAKRPLGVLEAARAFSVMLAGPVVLVGASLLSVLSTLSSLLRARPPAPLAVAGIAMTALYARLLRPWHLRWGAGPGDEDRELPGDELLPREGTQILHAVRIDAPAEEVWPWLAQLGQDRGGFYSYEWLENLAGCEMRNASEIHPEWQHRDVGETVFLHPAGGLEVTVFEPGIALGLENWGTLALVPIGKQRTRLIVRGRIPKGLVAAGYALLMEIPHFIMERRMLLGIKQRAERGRA